MQFRYCILFHAFQVRLLIVGVVLTITPLFLNAQTVKGTVYRANSDTTVANAVIYYGGSTTGTIANERGGFELKLKQQQIPIIVSCVGYYSSTVYYQPGKPLLVYLKPKIENLQTVTIRPDGMNRKDEIARFIREFLGTSAYALSCTIENMDDINLFYDKDRRTLTADCDKPIIIHNKKLGYTINYYLDKFKDTPDALTFAGNYIFKEDTIGAGKNWPKIIENREDAYEGSRMQLIRALWHNSIKKTGFKVFAGSLANPVNASSLIIDSVKQKYIHLEGALLVTTPAKSMRINQVFQNRVATFIDKSGYFGLGLQWSGPMASQRIGDLLPFEFQSKEEIRLYGVPNLDQVQAPPAVTATTSPKKPADIITTIEKAYLHTDREVYGQGEDIWYKAYVVNARDNTPVNDSHNLYVELIGPDAKLIKRENIRLEDGLGSGDFKLADAVSPGAYRIRAYTNWMRNFGDNFIFEKSIAILQTARAPAITTAMKKNKANITSATPTLNPVTTSVPTVRFFPEGGSMIDGLAGIVAVRAEDSNGHGVSATGNVINNDNQTVASFTCDSLGFGAFTLLPNVAQHYQALVTVYGENSRFILPQVTAEGFTLHAQAKDEVTVVSIACNDLTFSKMKGRQLLLTAKHGGQIHLKKVIPLNSGQLLVNIPNDLLPEGITVITLSDEKAQPLCERLVYIHHPGSRSLVLTTDKMVYKPKEKVTLNLKLNTTGLAHLSLAAVDAGTVPVQPGNILSYLNLQSEIKGRIEKAGRYFDTTNTNRFKQMDLLLLTQGWRNFVWKKLEDTTLRLTHKAEQGIAITGRVRRVGVNKGLPDMSVTMRAPNAEGQKLFSATTDSLGRFVIDNTRFYGYQYISLVSIKEGKINQDGESKGNSGGYIQVDSLLRDTLAIGPGMTFPITDTSRRDEEAAERIIKNLKIRDDHKLKEVIIKANKSRLFTQLPPELHPITLIEQKDYGNLAQYLLYMVEGSRLRWIQNKEYIIYKNQPNTIFPMALIAAYPDGFGPTGRYEQEELLNLPMSNILKVTINRIINAGGHNAWVDLVIRPGSLETKGYFANTTADMVGYYKAREFYQPTPKEVDDNIDNRVNTIHWEPNITIDKNDDATVNFYNTTQTGNIRLVVEGVTTNGTPLTTTIGYKVN